MATERRRNQCKDHVPVQLVIWFVGIMGVISLVAGVWLDYISRSSAGVLAITTGCVTGLLALLAQTRGGQREAQSDPPPSIIFPPGDSGGAATGTTAVAAVVTNEPKEPETE